MLLQGDGVITLTVLMSFTVVDMAMALMLAEMKDTSDFEPEVITYPEWTKALEIYGNTTHHGLYA